MHFAIAVVEPTPVNWRYRPKPVLALHSSERTLSWTDPRSCLQSALSASIDRLKTDHVTAEVRNAVPSLESKLLVYYCSLLNFYRWIILSVLKISGVKQSGLGWLMSRPASIGSVQ